MKLANPFTTLLKKLIDDQIFQKEQLPTILEHIRTRQLSLPTYLLTQAKIEPHWVANTLSEALSLPLIDLDTLDTEAIPLHIIDEKLLRQYPILPLWQKGTRLWIGMADPTQALVIEAVRFQTGLAVSPIIVAQPKLKALRETLLSNPQLSLQAITDLPRPTLLPHTQIDPVEDPPLVRYVNQLLQTALHKRASDIHFEPQGEQLHIRFRIDGVLYPQPSPPDTLRPRIMTRLKLMGSLDIAEQRLPQDGRFQITRASNDTIGQKKSTVDCRISTCPTIDGEKIVIRLLDGHQTSLDITDLGLTTSQQTIFLEALHHPQGMILVTGPTGSGKTLTLYSALHHLNTPSVNISSVEDPVEIHLPGINQVNVHPKIGLDFATVLRTFLRQDPDIIMLGEMRDRETAEVGIQAAQTGHLILSTLHTNSAAETLTRLSNIGIPAYNIAASVSLIIAQRLVRRLCPHCKYKQNRSQPILASEVLNLDQPSTVFTARGCQHCTEGYQGRTGIFELLTISNTIATAIFNKQAPAQITSLAQQAGMLTLKQSAFKKLQQGLIDLAEIRRVI